MLFTHVGYSKTSNCLVGEIVLCSQKEELLVAAIPSINVYKCALLPILGYAALDFSLCLFETEGVYVSAVHKTLRVPLKVQGDNLQ